ncbi:uncharacterized protein LOC143891996 [Tasmannia lanceolata]|uniref:uncharacterized protein LOC143891996 n=1 Tax=Tasmannia lanceolata TaxID=3420 RepID=UPI0040638929
MGFHAAIYQIWKERNFRIFESKSTHKTQILKRILGDICFKMNQLTACRETPHARAIEAAKIFGYKFSDMVRTVHHCSWAKPQKDEVKINSDASLESHCASIGGLIRDDLGMSLAMFSVDTDMEDIYVLELKAIFQGIILAKAKSYSKIWIESDSQFAVNIILKQESTPWNCWNLVSDIFTTLEGFVSWKITHSWREGNSPADLLSKPSYPFKGLDIPVEHSTAQLLHLIEEDRNEVKYARVYLR